MDRTSFLHILGASPLVSRVSGVISSGETKGASSVTVPTDPSFSGTPPALYSLTAVAGAAPGQVGIKQVDASSTVTLLNGSKGATLNVAPRFLNVPPQYFHGKGKPNAYAKFQVDQNTGLELIKDKPLSWAVLYTLIKNYNDDIQSQPLDQSAASAMVDIPSNDGLLYLRTPVGATVGGKSKTGVTFKNIMNHALGIANGAGQPYLPLTAAQLGIVEQMESLIVAVSDSLSASARMQYWISQDPIKVALTTSGLSADPSALPVTTGIYLFVPSDIPGASPAPDPDATKMNQAALAGILANSGYSFVFNSSNGSIQTFSNGSPVIPEPMSGIFYLTARLTTKVIT